MRAEAEYYRVKGIKQRHLTSSEGDILPILRLVDQLKSQSVPGIHLPKVHATVGPGAQTPDNDRGTLIMWMVRNPAVCLQTFDTEI